MTKFLIALIAVCVVLLAGVECRPKFLKENEPKIKTGNIPKYKTAYVTQYLDHFKFNDDRTFQQRYLYNGENSAH
jgi:hypothetical protein